MKKEKLITLLMTSAYMGLLDAAFLWRVKPVYGYQVQYQGYGSINNLKVIVGHMAMIIGLIAFWRLKRDAPVTRFVVFMQLALILIPFAVLYGLEDLPTWHLGMVLLGYISMTFMGQSMRAVKTKMPTVQVRVVLAALMFGILLYVYTGLVITGGMGRLNFNFLEIYSVRENYVENRLPLFGYFVPWVAYIFNITLLVGCLRSLGVRKMIPLGGVAIVVCMQMLLFGMTNYKAFLFIPFVVMGLMILARRMDVAKAVLLGLPITIGALVLIDVVGSSFGGALLSRLFFMPAALHSIYFKYFSVHPFALLGDTIGGFFGSSYQKPIVLIIAEHFWGTIFDPNVGWIADAYANFGAIGIIVYGLVLGVLLRVADGLVGSHIAPGVVEGLMVGPVFALCSSALPTVMVTHGFLIILLVLWFLKGSWREDGDYELDDLVLIQSHLRAHGK